MDASEGVGQADTANVDSNAEGTINISTATDDNATAVNTSAQIETPPPSEGCNNAVEATHGNEPKTSAAAEAEPEATPILTNETDEPTATTSRSEQNVENSVVEQTPRAEAQRPNISAYAAAFINEAAALINEEIDAQLELDRELGSPSSVLADNMELIANEASINSRDNIWSQALEHDDSIEHVHYVDDNLQHDHDNNDNDDDDINFDPSPLIDPLLEDDDMEEQRLDDDDVNDDEQQPIDGENEGEDNLMLEDISDDASSSSDAVFDDDMMRAAFREMLVQNRRGGENFMQRLRSAFFTMEHNRERRRNEPENNEVEIEEPEPENPVSFDTSLPAEHSYLGENMNRVSGVHYLEVGQQYNMMLFMHQHILFPGEILPFMISGSIIESDMDAQNGLLFGVCFPILCNSEEVDDNFYGVTCQIYEKGTDERGNVLIKSRALQRFVTKGSQVTGPLSFIAAHPQLKVYGTVRILPEIFLREPLKCLDMGSLNRFRDIESMSNTYKRYQAATTAWPAHVYDYYSITAIVEKARSQLAQHKIDTMPTDPTQLSFWLVRNLHLSDSLMRTIFLTDSVNIRMKLISNTFTDDSVFTCRYCGNRIANCQQLFAMSKHGVQTQYCNSDLTQNVREEGNRNIKIKILLLHSKFHASEVAAGYIHETNTVYQLLPDAITYNGQPSAEFSWFPGYEWHIIVCKICSRHIGWKFKALEPNLVPKSFFGISSSSVRITSPSPGNTNTRAGVFQSLMRLARREMQ